MVLKETGWTRQYLLWKISWLNVQMMIADAPTIKRKGKADDKKKVAGKELAEWLRQKKIAPNG